MTRETKIRVTVTIVGWVVAAIIQAFSFGYFFGALKQEVRSLGQRLDLIEQRQKTKEVNDELEKDFIVCSGCPSGGHSEQRSGQQRQRATYPLHRGDCAPASGPDRYQIDLGPFYDSAESGIRLGQGHSLPLDSLPYPAKNGRKVFQFWRGLERAPGDPAGRPAVGENQ